MDDEYVKVARGYTSQFAMDSLLTQDFWEMMSSVVVVDPYCKEYAFIVNHLYSLEKLGVDMYALEDELNYNMLLAMNDLYSAVLDKRKGVPTEGFEEKVAYLQPLLKQPVKGFSIRQVELAALECMYGEDTDKLYERMHVFMDCDMVLTSGSMLFEDIFRYLIGNLKDKRKVEECVDYIKNKSGMSKSTVQGFVNLGEKQIEQLSGESAE